MEINGIYTHNISQSQNTIANDNYGGRIGFGITDQTDIKLQYEHLFGSGDNTSECNYLSIVPKQAILKDKLSIIVPLSCYFTDAIVEDGKHIEIAIL